MKESQFSLSGRVGLVTGSTGGIGRAIAEELTRAGARIAINGRNQEKVNLVAKSLEGALNAPFDVDDHASAEDAIDKIILETGRFDILVCSVGSRDRRSISEIDATEFQDLLFTNTVSAYQLARAASKKMPNPNVGRLIFISSIASLRPFRSDPSYSASKAALESIVRSFCYKLSRDGITANAIAPGFFPTELTDDVGELLGTRGKPEFQHKDGHALKRLRMLRFSWLLMPLVTLTGMCLLSTLAYQQIFNGVRATPLK